MALLTREALEKPVALKEAVVDFLDGQVLLKQLTAAEAMEHIVFIAEKTDNHKVMYPHAMAAYLFRCVKNADGTPFFKSIDDAIALLGKQTFAVVNKLFDEAEKVNADTALTEEAITEEAKNSEAAPSENSSSPPSA